MKITGKIHEINDLKEIKEGFQKRELEIGVNDGMDVQVSAGIKEGERVVIKGGVQIKLATMSGKMPAHGHEH